MPRQDASGRWISDDGLTYWDGSNWWPIGATPVPPAQSRMPGTTAYPPAYPPADPVAQARSSSRWRGVLIGCGLAFVLVLILGITCTVITVSNSDFQRGFCNSYTANNTNLTCPFNPPPASP